MMILRPLVTFSGMSKTKNKETGDIGESAACRYLERRGYRIVDTKVRVSWCEVDIIAERRGRVHFIEVKSVSRPAPPTVGNSLQADTYRPEELVHATKLRKISRFADYYMNKGSDQRDYQIDVVGVFLDHVRRVAHCRLTENVTS